VVVEERIGENLEDRIGNIITRGEPAESPRAGSCGEGGGSGMEGGNGAALDSAEPESSTATEREREKERKRERERETIRIVDRDR